MESGSSACMKGERIKARCASFRIDHFIATGMALVNCSVVNCTSNKTVFPWSIMSAGKSGVTIQQFTMNTYFANLKKWNFNWHFLENPRILWTKLNCRCPSTLLSLPLGLFCATRPSLQRTPKRKKTLSFSASIQHVKNVNLMLQCDECAMWGLLYSKVKLTKKERADLQVAIEDISFTCGASLQDIELPGCLNDV